MFVYCPMLQILTDILTAIFPCKLSMKPVYPTMLVKQCLSDSTFGGLKIVKNWSTVSPQTVLCFIFATILCILFVLVMKSKHTKFSLNLCHYAALKL